MRRPELYIDEALLSSKALLQDSDIANSASAVRPVDLETKGTQAAVISPAWA